jgi:hypothetical protein
MSAEAQLPMPAIAILIFLPNLDSYQIIPTY